MKVPTHVGIILDGNGRWAEKRGEKRVLGHFAGEENVEKVTKYLFGRGVEHVSLYAFSKENLARPKEEVDGILTAVYKFVSVFTTLFPQKRLVVSGEVPFGELREKIREVETATAMFCKTVNILLFYNGADEIIRAFERMQEKGLAFSEENLRANLYAPLPYPDLVIRTGGEKRLSGFMPLQTAYAELYFTDVLFPDLNEKDLSDALEDFSLRDRRFGKIKND